MSESIIPGMPRRFGALSVSGMSSARSILPKVSGVRWRLSMPSMATEMEPVSSETMATTASECSLMPMPALWRMPRSELSEALFESGSIQPAAARRPSRIITAPSCSGEFTKKMLRSSSLETSAFTTVPVAIWSLRELVRSKTMSAPVRLSDMMVQASTVWFMTDSIVAGTPGAPKK